MAIQSNIGEAKSRLSQLVAASERGDEVLLARAGKVVAQIVALSAATAPGENPAAAALRRAAAFDANAAIAAGGDRMPDIGPSMSDAEMEDRWQRKFGPAR